MRISSVLTLFVLLLGLSACVPTAQIAMPDMSTAQEARQLLVTFVDRTIDRDLPGNSQDYYRSRGRYDNSGWAERIAQELAGRHQLRLLAQWPVTALGVSCAVFEVPFGRSIAEVEQRLFQDGRVDSVQTMRSYRVLGKPSLAVPYSDPYLKLQKGFQAMRIAGAHRFATGRGVPMAVVDSGVDVQHPDLRGQIERSENFAPEAEEGGSAEVHGTAVAGVLAAHADNGIGIAGVAPGARLFALRACWPDRPASAAARCNSYTLALALNEAIRLGVRIVNLSLTGPDDPLVGKLIEQALRRQMIVVAADPGAGAAERFPADVSGVIAVADGAAGDGSLAAPGSDVLTTLPGDRYDFMSGSSFAAPHIAGLIALVLELRPQWGREEIGRLLNDPSLVSDKRALDACLVIAKFAGKGSPSDCPQDLAYGKQ